jgi:hypothetical protein
MIRLKTGQTDEEVNRRKAEWMDGWMDGWMNQ